MIEIEGEYTEAKIFSSERQESAIEQIQDITNHPAFDMPVRVMCDYHWGMGSTIGFTMPINKNDLKIAPATIGVDVGCGVMAIDFGELERSVFSGESDYLDDQIRDRIPMGFDIHNRGNYHLKNKFPWGKVNSKLSKLENNLLRIIGSDEVLLGNTGDNTGKMEYDMDYLEGLVERSGKSMSYVINSIGSLGGGNHFIELGVGKNDHLWAVIHSGSRGPGNRVASYWIDKATEITKEKSDEKFKKEVSKIKENYEVEMIEKKINELSDSLRSNNDNDNLDYLHENEAYGYIIDMIFLQEYALQNRKEMARQITEVLDRKPIDVIHSVHNYIDFDDCIIRKGATPARSGEKGVIPFDMKNGTIIFEGKGNENWNYSAPHGAGRVMSRSGAKDKLDMKEVRKDMEDVYTSNIPIDEAPDAYKSAGVIMEEIKATAEVKNMIKPLLNIKA